MKNTQTTRIKGSNYLLNIKGELFREKGNGDIIPVAWVKNKKYGYCGYSITINTEKVFHNSQVWVWITYWGDIEKGLTVNHKDLDKTNNNLDNLELTTYKQNTSHWLETKGFKTYVIDFIDSDLKTTVTIKTHQDVMNFCCLENRSDSQRIIKQGFFKHYKVEKRYLNSYKQL